MAKNRIKSNKYKQTFQGEILYKLMNLRNMKRVKLFRERIKHPVF